MELQPLAAGARTHLEAPSLQVASRDALAAPEAQLPAERRDLESALAFPRQRRERRGQRLVGSDLAAIDPQHLAAMREARSRAGRGELLQHLDELRLARRLQLLSFQVLAQELSRTQVSGGKVPRSTCERALPLGEARRDERPQPAAHEVSRERL